MGLVDHGGLRCVFIGYLGRHLSRDLFLPQAMSLFNHDTSHNTTVFLMFSFLKTLGRIGHVDLILLAFCSCRSQPCNVSYWSFGTPLAPSLFTYVFHVIMDEMCRERGVCYCWSLPYRTARLLISSKLLVHQICM